MSTVLILAALPYYMVQEKSTLVKVLPNIEGPKYEAHFVYPEFQNDLEKTTMWALLKL